MAERGENMSKGRGRNNYPSFYGKNAARNAERRYLLTRKTKAAVLTEKRQRVTETLSKYIQLSLVKYFKAKQDDIDRIGSEVDTISRWYQGILDIQGEKRAHELQFNAPPLKTETC